MEIYEINKAIEDFVVRLKELTKALDIAKIENNVLKNETKTNESDFWNDNQNASKVLKAIKEDKNKLDTIKLLNQNLEDLNFFFEMIKSGEEVLDIEDQINKFENDLNEFEIKILLSKEYDDFDAIITLHPGAGGTESQDWAEMLFRMYRKYAEKKGFEFEVIDYLDGEEAGIKSVTFMINGDKAYGYLKAEHGVHRLVRISPFDSNARRHTSFCACNVIPSVDKEINIEVLPEDIRVDTYRSSSAGGQHVNTTDSAIRITHLKTGLVVTCQNERSQIQNREKAMKVLKARLYQLELETQEKNIKSINEISENSFGSQIRSYVFHPYSMIKDHRTNYESFNVEAVMNGEIEGFINAFLKSEYNKK
ncbi:MAG: peptide chain release factor 2 [Bacilli bacterium]|nr:peptide chain release factor 2 [Bacilli bacterium]